MSANEIADRIITALEGRFRDWLMSDEHAEARSLVAEIVERELGVAARRKRPGWASWGNEVECDVNISANARGATDAPVSPKE